MKRILAFVLILCITLPGCSIFTEKQTTTFYYPRVEFLHGVADGVIASEERDATSGSLPYLLSLYLIGPVEEGLRSPLPASVGIEAVAQLPDRVELTLSDTHDVLTEAEFSLACACLAKTCFALTGTEKVHIISGSRDKLVTEDILTLYDNYTPSTEETQ